jgi:iron(III) transport system permease protein
MGASTGALLIAIPLAFLTGRTDVFARRLLSAMALMPLALPPYNVALALQPWLPKAPLLATSLVLALALYPIAFVFLRAGFTSVDPSLEEASLVVRGKWATLRFITWPLVRPWATAAYGVVFLLGLGEFGAPALLGLPVYPAWIALRFSATYDAGGAALQALPLTSAVLLIFAVEKAALFRSAAFLSRLRRPTSMALGSLRLPATVLCLGIVLASPGIPLMATAVEVDYDGLKTALPLAAGPAWNSLLVASGSCLLAMGAAAAIALLARRGSRHFRSISLGFFVLPGAILGIGLIGFWNRPAMPPVYGTSLLLVLAVTLRYTVLAERALDAGLSGIPRSQEEIARLAGRGEGAVAFRILLPQVWAAVAAGATVFLLFALRDLDTVVTIYPPGGETLTVRLYALLANSPRGVQAALSLAQVGLSLPVLTLFAVVLGRSRWLR